ncbi:MAG: hypothetical protein AAGJ34_02805 [Pseudomonadota bacterium]
MRYGILPFLPLFLAAQAQFSHAENWIWAVWENESVDPLLCAERGFCDPISTYISVIQEKPTREEAKRIIGALTLHSNTRANLKQTKPPPPICKHVDAASVLGFDPELWEMSDRALALRGLEGVYLSVEKMRGPESYGDSFGTDLQAKIQERFDRVGLKVLTEDEMYAHPGQPEMNIYFSNTNPDTGCQFRLYAGVSQTVLLSRNHTVKIKAGTWGMTGGYVKEDPSVDEMRSILIVVDAFLAAWVDANAG